MTPPAARLLDLTRLAGRATRVLTGVDRIERAWLAAIVRDESALAFALVRTRPGYLLLDRAGMRAFLEALDHGNWGGTRLYDRLARRDDPDRALVEGFLRRHILARAPHRWLSLMLRRRLPGAVSYVNVGQTTLHEDTVTGLRALPGARITVMLHDTIPLDFPQFQRPGTVDQFRQRLALVVEHADRILCTSASVASDLRRHCPGQALPEITVAHPGVTLAVPDPAALPHGPRPSPCFVTLNTIDPRKNHALLLDTWERLGPGAPPLLIVGSRGWADDALLARLDAHPSGVQELSGLSDGAVAALVAGATAMLNPSLAEGFGLPSLEAAGRGVPLVCADLPVWREMLGEYPVYLDPQDADLWAKTVMSLTKAAPRKAPLALPGWDAHFTTVFAVI